MYTYDIEELVNNYSDMVKRLAYTYLKNDADADDVVQDIFYKVIDKSPEFSTKQHAKAWFIRATINMCKNRFKLFWNRNKQSIDSIAEAASFDSYSTDNAVLNAVISLPEKYRCIIYLYYYEQYSTAEIAKILNKNDSTIRSILHRARKKLKDILVDEYDFTE